jgi:hypothetical protein
LHARRCVHACMCVCAFACVRLWACVRVCLRACMRAPVGAHACKCVQACVRACVSMSLCAFVRPSERRRCADWAGELGERGRSLVEVLALYVFMLQVFHASEPRPASWMGCG